MRINFEIPDTEHKVFKIMCTQNSVTISERLRFLISRDIDSARIAGTSSSAQSLIVHVNAPKRTKRKAAKRV